MLRWLVAVRKSNYRSVKRLINHPMHGGNLVWAASLANCSPSAILDFSASINPLGPPASAIAAIQSHLQDLKVYPDPQYHQLRAALSTFHQIPPDWILPGNGVAELLTWACRDLSALHGTCLLTPAFSDYQRALSAFGAKIVHCPLEDLRSPDLDRALKFAPAGTQLQKSNGLLLNNPHNPTGIVFRRESVLPWLKQFALVVVDEAFMDFLPESQQQSLINQVQDYPNLVVLRSLTKFYSLPGLRLGYAIAQPERLQRWQQWRDPWAVNVLAAAAGEVVVHDLEFQQQTWNWLTTAKPPLYDGLLQLPGLAPYPGSVNFLLVESAHPVIELQRALLEHHRILIRDCISFPELGDRYFRIAIRSELENQMLLRGLAGVLGR